MLLWELVSLVMDLMCKRFRHDQALSSNPLETVPCKNGWCFRRNHHDPPPSPKQSPDKIVSVYVSVLFKRQAPHLDPLLSAGFDTLVPVFIFLIFFLVPVWALKCRFCRKNDEKMKKRRSNFLGKALRAVPALLLTVRSLLQTVEFFYLQLTI